MCTLTLASNVDSCIVLPAGDWAGHALRNFLGHDESRPSDKTFVGLYAQLKTMINTLDESKIDERVNKQDLLAMVEVLEIMSKKLAAAHRFYASIQTVESDDELEAGIRACKDYVSYYRSTLCKDCKLNCMTKTGSGRAKTCKPKHHILETHVPIFARVWRCVSRFAEDVVESMHREVNKIMDTLTNLSNQHLKMMQLVDDRLNLLFEQEARKEVRTKPKRRTKRQRLS